MKKLLFPLLLGIVGLGLVATSFLTKTNSNGGLDVEIEKASFIMPAAHKVYANPEVLDGKYYLFKAKITNNTGVKLEDVEVRYRIPDYVEWTDLETVGEMFDGQTAAVVCYPKFSDNITEKTTESMEKVEIEITWDDMKEDDAIEEEFAFKLTNRNDYVYTGIPADEISSWGDVYDNDALFACFVTPNDPVIKYYTQVVQEKVLKGDQASVSQDPKDGVRFLMGIYEATRMSHMVYSGTKGIPQSLDDVQAMTQHVRLPREVVTGNTGLCIELSALYASMLSAAGINPIIFMVPGHAYPGFRMNGQYFAIEATGIGGEGLGQIISAEDAFKAGQKQLEEFIKKAQMGDPRYSIVDVHTLNQQGVTSMSLPDNEFLRKKVDEIAQNFVPGKSSNRNQQSPNQTQQVTHNPNPNPNPNPRPAPRPSSSGFIPSGWATYQNPAPEVPILSLQAMSPDQTMSIAVYDVPARSTTEAMNMINQYANALGLELQYQAQGNALVGQTASYEGNFRWIGKALPGSNGIRIVTIGTPDYLFQQNQAQMNTIFNNIR